MIDNLTFVSFQTDKYAILNKMLNQYFYLNFSKYFVEFSV